MLLKILKDIFFMDLDLLLAIWLRFCLCVMGYCVLALIYNARILAKRKKREERRRKEKENKN